MKLAKIFAMILAVSTLTTTPLMAETHNWGGGNFSLNLNQNVAQPKYGKSLPSSEEEIDVLRWEDEEHNDVNAQYTLGECYFYGDIVSQDYEKAFRYYKAAADQGHTEAQYKVGECYFNGIGTKKDVIEAFNYYEKAGNSGHIEAQYKLGKSYAVGDGIPKDTEVAKSWYEKAATNGDIQSQYNLGELYADDGDYNQAVYWWTQAANQGNSNAKNQLAIYNAYEDRILDKNGQNNLVQDNNQSEPEDKEIDTDQTQNQDTINQPIVDQTQNQDTTNQPIVDQTQNPTMPNQPSTTQKPTIDPTKPNRTLTQAEQLFQEYKAKAEQGDVEAQNRLGNCYARGLGTTKNEYEAQVWYQKAALKGYPYAQYNLGDYTNAKKGFKELAAKGDLEAQYLLGGEEREKAIEGFEKLAYQGNDMAQWRMGIYWSTYPEEKQYGKEYFGNSSRQKIIYYMSNAANQRYVEAQCFLAHNYNYGNYVYSHYNGHDDQGESYIDDTERSKCNERAAEQGWTKENGRSDMTKYVEPTLYTSQIKTQPVKPTTNQTTQRPTQTTNTSTNTTTTDSTTTNTTTDTTTSTPTNTTTDTTTTTPTDTTTDTTTSTPTDTITNKPSNTTTPSSTTNNNTSKPNTSTNRPTGSNNTTNRPTQSNNTSQTPTNSNQSTNSPTYITQNNITQNNVTQVQQVQNNYSITDNSINVAVGENGLRKGTVEFRIGESKYTVDGQDVEMDATSYIQDPGFTMVSVRYVAESFGVSSGDITFSDGTITIKAGNRTIQLHNNSNIAYVDNTPVQMEASVMIKDDRTYAPIGEVAKMLDVDKEWDNTTKTATFTN